MSAKRIMVTLFVAALLLPVLPHTFAEVGITVDTDKEYYNPGDIVKVNGTAPTGKVLLEFNKTMTTIYKRNVTAYSNKFSYDYVLPFDAAIGIWTVRAMNISSGMSAQEDFKVLKNATSTIALGMIEIAKTANQTTYDELFVPEGTPPRAAVENYQHGQDAIEAAENFYAVGKYTPAIEAAHRAQKHFENALKIAFREHPEDDEDDEEAELAERLERAFSYLQKVNATFMNMEGDLESGKKGDIEELLGNASDTLTYAQEELSAGNYTSAGNLIKEGNELIKEALDELKDEAREQKRDLADKFIEKMEERIDKIIEAIEKGKNNLPQGKGNEILARLRAALKRLEQLRNRVNAGQIDMEGIEDEIQSLEDAINDLGDEAFELKLKEMNRLHAWVQEMQETKNKFMKRGLGTDDIDDDIEEGNQILGRTISEFAKGQKWSNNSLSAMYNKFSDLVHHYQAEYGIGHKGGD